MKAKTNVSKAKSRRGFTLVEMIVVISMIAALAGISFPVYRSIQKKVEKSRATMLIGQLERAIDNFETEYNHLPYIGAAYPGVDQVLVGETANDVSDLMTVLVGEGTNCNFKKITFFEWDEPKGGPGNYKDGLLISGGRATLYSPWGWEYQRMRLDYTADGEMPYPYDGSKTVYGKKMIIWDTGSDGLWYTFGGTVDDDVHNFEGPDTF